MTSPSGPLVRPYANGLEPARLLGHFLQHPPEGFSTRLSAHGVMYFHAPFTLLTAMEASLQRRMRNWPGYRLWSRWFVFDDTCFIGTTVSEYARLPRDLSAGELAEWLRDVCAPRQKLTIVKDIPQQSPLLSALDNAHAGQLQRACENLGFISVEGQALAYVPIDFADIDEYLSRMSRSRRRDMRRKLRNRDQLRVEVLHTGDPRFGDHDWVKALHALYLAVHEQSHVHFDLLTEDFFYAALNDGGSAGRVFCYWRDDELVGFNLCYVHGTVLVDKYIGLRYPQAHELNLYFVSWFVNLEHAREHGLKFYVAGWTDPQVKASLGARFTFTRHLVWVRHPLLRRVLNRFRHYFEGETLAMAATS